LSRSATRNGGRSWLMAATQLGQQVQARIVAQAARRIGSETLIVIDPTEVRKHYAQAMPYLATARDGNPGERANGYWNDKRDP
jgi:hypothetical protein